MLRPSVSTSAGQSDSVDGAAVEEAAAAAKAPNPAGAADALDEDPVGGALTDLAWDAHALKAAFELQDRHLEVVSGEAVGLWPKARSGLRYFKAQLYSRFAIFVKNYTWRICLLWQRYTSRTGATLASYSCGLSCILCHREAEELGTRCSLDRLIQVMGFKIKIGKERNQY